MNAVLAALRTLIPIVQEGRHGGKKLSKESTLHLGEAVLGVLIIFGFFSPGEVDVAELNGQIWTAVESIMGLWITVRGLAANFRRHREAGG